MEQSDSLSQIGVNASGANSTNPIGGNSVVQNESVPVPAPQAPVVTEYAGVWSRWCASLLDSLLLFVFNIPLYIIFGILTAFLKESLSFLTFILPLIQFVVQISISIYYLAVYQHKKGQTIGRKIMKIKVVTLDGQTPTVGKFVMRETVFKWVSALILIGYLWALWDSKKQTIHDKLAGTVVVKV